jgi:hypothetical protein
MTTILTKALEVKSHAEDMLMLQLPPGMRSDVMKIIKETRDIIKEHGGRL